VEFPARVEVRGDHLEWTDNETGWGSRFGKIDSSCLRRFVRLAGKPAEQIAAFAQNHGVLYLSSENGFPVLEKNDIPFRIDDDYPPTVGPKIGGELLITHRLWRQEPIEGWRAWSRYVGIVLVLSYELRKGDRIIAPEVRLRKYIDHGDLDLGLKDTWLEDDSPYLERGPDGAMVLSDLGRTIYNRLWPWRLMRELEQRKTAEEQWRWLARDMSARLFPQVEFAIHLDGTADRPQVVLDRPFNERFLAGVGVHRTHYVLSSIAGQLLATIRGDMNHCFDCGLPYPIKRRRARGRCPECARIASNKSARRSKARTRAAQGEMTG
jgi:hypothetical protein